MTLGAVYLNTQASSAKNAYSKNFAQRNPENPEDIFSASNSEKTAASSEDLRSKLKQAQDKQGFIGKLWNGVKKLTGLGLSSKKVEEKIKQYESGQISYEEAEKSISSYEQKQDSVVDMASSITSGLVVTGTAIVSGGTSLLASAAIGGAAKTALKTVDRATNNVKGDEINLKQMGKDAMTGAVDGVITTVTMGGAKAVETVAGQSVKEAAKQGAIQGAKCGALAGGAMSTTNYAAEAVFEKDVDFSIGGAVKSGVKGAVVGGVLGGILGGAASGIKQAKVNRPIENASKQLHNKYEGNIKKVESEYKEHFGDLDSVEEITSRAKGTKSVQDKLFEKYRKGKFASADVDSCAEVIGDGMGARVQLKSLTPEEAKNIINESLKGTGKTYDDFILAIKSKKTLSEEYISALDSLKEAQTDEFVDVLCKKIKSGDIKMMDEFNNYGDEITSYFSNKQLRKIGIAYEEATGSTPTFINKTQVTKDSIYGKYGDKVSVFKTNTERAMKESGYPTAQANTISSKTNGTPLADTEFQVRGVDVNKFADIEHIVYDIRKGKISASDPKYSDVYKILKGLSEKSCDDINKYSADVYKYLRLKELGIETTLPTSPSVLTYASKENLIKAGLKNIRSKAGQQLTEEEIAALVKRQLLNYQG